MSTKEVTELRKSGKIREAYHLALLDYKEDEKNEWAQTSLFWVIRDLCQQAIDDNCITDAKHWLSKMASLLPTMKDDKGLGQKTYDFLYKKSQPNAGLISQASALSKTDPAGAYEQVKSIINSPNELDPVLHVDLGWILFRYLKECKANLSLLDTKKLLQAYLTLKNERPSMLHSQILIFALSLSKEPFDFSFYRFFMLWGPQNFRQEDLQISSYNEKKIPSLISRCFHQIAFCGENVDVTALCDKIDLSKGKVLDLLREQQFWKIMNLHKEGKSTEMFEAFSLYNKFNASYGASLWNSKVLSFAERYLDGQDTWRFVSFFKDWGFENFMPSDWEKGKDNKGNSYNPLAVKVAKKCFDYIKALHPLNAALVDWMDSFYDYLIRHIEQDEWILRQRAIIYIWQQKYESAIKVYKSLILEMGEKYYIWSELADCIQDSNQLKIALLSKALLLEHNENFLGAIHLNLSDLLLKEGLMSESLTELNIYKQSHDKPSKKYQDLIQLIDGATIPLKNNFLLYNKYAAYAEDYAFSEIESKEVTMVDRWDKDGKKHCSFSNGLELSFQVNVKRFPFINKAVLGSVFNVKCHEEVVLNSLTCSSETKFIPLCMHRSESKPWSGLPLKYGFVEYLNVEKKILHVVTQDSEQVFPSFKEKWGSVSKGDFISFRCYPMLIKGGKKRAVVNIEKVSKASALSYFSSGVVVVNNVNRQKNLFHYTFGENEMGGNVFFNETKLRPQVGQCLKIAYCVTKDKNGKKRSVVLNMEETTEQNHNALKRIHGLLKLKYYENSDYDSPDFAFIDDYYVHNSVLSKTDITADCVVNADVVYEGNGKWKVINICQ